MLHSTVWDGGTESHFVIFVLRPGVRMTHVILQQDEHAPLCQLFGCDELVPGLLDLLCRDFPAPSPFVVQIQPTAIHLLQLVLRNRKSSRKHNSSFRSGPLLRKYWTNRKLEQKSSHPDVFQLHVVEVLQGIDEGVFDVDIQFVSGNSHLMQSFTNFRQSTAWSTQGPTRNGWGQDKGQSGGPTRGWTRGSNMGPTKGGGGAKGPIRRWTVERTKQRGIQRTNQRKMRRISQSTNQRMDQKTNSWSNRWRGGGRAAGTYRRRTRRQRMGEKQMTNQKTDQSKRKPEDQPVNQPEEEEAQQNKGPL